MQEFSAFINHCAEQFQKINICQNCTYGQCIHPWSGIVDHDCYACLYKIHYYQNTELTYQCDRIIFNYVLKHGHRYASEMDKVLALFKQHAHLPNEMNIFSIGCGPCTELFGIVRNFSESIIHFKGFDLTEVWKPLTDYEKVLFPNIDINFHVMDFFDYMSENEGQVDILILNYMLSDLARYKTPVECSFFIDRLVGLCEQRRIKNIVINDVYLCYSEKTGYVLMEELARKLQACKSIETTIGRGRFAVPKTGQPQYGTYKGSEELTFPIVEQSARPFDPFPICGSILMLVLIQ